MPSPDLVDRATGALLGLAIGDALGMPTQTLTRAQIAATYGPITGFRDATADQPIAPGLPAGTITDDTEQALMLARLLIEGHGRIDPRTFADALAAWEEDMIARGSQDLLGPSTKAAIAAIQAGAGPDDDPGRNGTTNGAAMRIAPVGIAVAPGPDLLPAVVSASRLTHNTGPGLASAAAVAAAVSAALTGAPTAAILTAGIEAADALADAGNHVSADPVGDRIRTAVAAVAGLDETVALEVIATRVGTSVAANESIPAAFALIARFGDQPFTALCHAAAIGDDTDTIGAIAGAILGAQHGTAAWPDEVTDTVIRVNHLDLPPVVADLLALRTESAR
ncbi:ADP-ribosylglycohydrolase family protein [Microbacterium gorillae]|uniref:ADP-ribosylglycohydrolase family protein n=1 Tax=Microbacterium gorillae TaxID=1231063 RepID=UPI00058E8F77|nr:ADP-ribosylglycohydrolase family protein [Microbacterium gorillae]